MHLPNSATVAAHADRVNFDTRGHREFSCTGCIAGVLRVPLEKKYESNSTSIFPKEPQAWSAYA